MISIKSHTNHHIAFPSNHALEKPTSLEHTQHPINRIAISVLSLFGTSPRMIMLGFMIPTMLLSMWISNTATSVLMIPILEVTLLLAITINILKGFLNCSGCAGWDRSECKCDEDDVPCNLLLGKCRRNWNSDRWQLIYNSMFSCNIDRNWHLCSGTPPNLIMYDFLGDFPNQPVSSLSEWNIASTNNMNYDDIIKGEFPLLDGL